MSRKGFAPILIIILVGVLILASGVWYYAIKPTAQTISNSQTAGTQSTIINTPTAIVKSSSSIALENYVRSKLFAAALPKTPIHDVYLGSYGNVSTSILQQIKTIIESGIGVKTTILQGTQESFPEKPPFYNSTRQQYDADYIWQSLISLQQQYGSSVRLLTIVDVDLFTTVQSSGTKQYVFSRALPNINAALISLYRIKQLSDSSTSPAPQNLIDSRLKKLILRTLGVTVGFSISPSNNDISCIMYQSLDLTNLDKKGDHFCKPEIDAMSKTFQISTSTK